jgi:phage antirepressor YoqD-like protein
VRQDDNRSVQEADFQDDTCNECVEKITQLAALIEIEEAKLFEAMRNATKLKEHL